MNAHSLLTPTEQLLLQGGDERLALGDAGLNKYGCGAWPEPALAAFGSSTATAVSGAGYAAAHRLRRRLLAGASHGAQTLYRQASERIRTEIKALCGLSDLPGLEVALAASGTDLHLIAAVWAAAASDGRRPLVIMTDPAETGRGVANALRGRHFAGHSALGHALIEGTPLDPRLAVDVAQISLRDDSGQARRLSDIDQEVETLAAQAIAGGQRVLLVALDVSKTGLLAPSPRCVAALRRRWPQQLDVMVDACQFRLSNATLRRYLEAGCLVAITGSKFITGPSFSGALFVPATAQLRASALPGVLRAYCARAEWPAAWGAGAAFDEAVNFGLLLRWEAALTEWRAWCQLPPGPVRAFVTAFGAAVQDRLMADRHFEPLCAPPLDRGELGDAGCWDALPSIFSFVLHRVADDGSRVALSRDQTAALYQRLPLDMATPVNRRGLGIAMSDINDSGAAAAALRCQFGQPVACGCRDGTPLSALRLSLSARLVAEALADGGTGAERVIRRALAALDKAAWLVQALHAPKPELHHA